MFVPLKLEPAIVPLAVISFWTLILPLTNILPLNSWVSVISSPKILSYSSMLF